MGAAARRASAIWALVQTPRWLARVVFFVGLVSLLSAVSPGLRQRAHLVNELVPAAFPAAATTGAAAVGLMLMALSRGLRRGKRRAWVFAMVLSTVAVGLHLLKGLDVEEALLAGALLALLIRARAEFVALPDPRSLRRVVTVLVVGPLLGCALGWVWLSVDSRGQDPGTTTGDRVVHAALGLLGIDGPIVFRDHSDDATAAVALVVLGGAVLLTAIVVALQPAGGPHPLSADEKARLRVLLDRWGDQDSLSYFALRDDRSVIVSPSGKAAITYRVVGTVSLAAGDPIGDPEAWPGAIKAWLDEARSYGWTPAVLAASEQAAEAYHRAGFDALELGDEAIIEVAEFTLDGRQMRGVRQATARCARAGLTVTCHRVADLDAAALTEIAQCAQRWRDGDVERGFSMALGRFGEDQDGRALVVVSRDASGALRGLLHMVPWGHEGLSLDLMRRDPTADNGVVEQLVVTVIDQAAQIGIKRISLNFAVFRSVFARGERLGAGMVLRAWRSVLLELSRFWQIESLYRANAKYHPEWVPRFVCFRSSGDLPRVGIAALRAEAFLVAPAWVRRVVGQ